MPRQELVGRTAEVAELVSRLSEAGSARLVLLTGPSGIGKTALSRHVADLHRGPVLTARAAPWEQEYAGGVLTQLLGSQAPASAAAGYTALADALEPRLAEGATPGLLVVDDADCADAPSLQALSTLVRYRSDLPVVVLLLATVVTPLLTRLGAEHVELGGLDATAMAELAAATGHALDASAVHALTRHVAGNPRDALALLQETTTERWLRADPQLPAPSYLVAELADRLDALAAPARAATEAIAVLDGKAPLARVIALAGLSGDGLAAVSDAAAAGLVVIDRDRTVRIPRPLARLAVLSLIEPVRAQALQRRAADLAETPLARLEHLVAATPGIDDGLAAELDQAAHTQAQLGAWADAARLWARASRITGARDQAEAWTIRSVDALVAAGSLPAATAQVPLIETLSETALRDMVLGYLAILRGRRDEAAARLGRARDLVDGATEPEIAAMIAKRQVLHALADCRGIDLMQAADAAVGYVGIDAREGLEAASIRPLGQAAAGDADGAHRAYADLAARLSPGVQSQRLTMGRGWLDFIRGDFESARVQLESTLFTDRSGGSTRTALWAHAWLARLQVHTGDWTAALTTASHGLALAQDSGITLITPLLLWTTSQVHALRGSWEQANTDVRTAEALEHGYAIMQIPCRLARAQLAETRNDHAAVIRALSPLLDPPADSTIDVPGFWPWHDIYANALIGDGQLEAAAEFLGRCEPAAAHHRTTLARLGSARGRLLGTLGDVAAAEDAFTSSMATFEEAGLRYDLARTAYAYGQTLRRAGRRRDAEPVLSKARDHFLSLDAKAYVERCERELRAGGLQPTPRDVSSHQQLTPQEESVASLVAHGLSNREVATQLFVSPKTVEYHLTHIYAKLGIRTRGELASTYPGTAARIGDIAP